RRAKRAGFDDALFVDAKGRVSEGSIWNIGFWDGAQVTWPRAEALRGITERLLQAGLAESGIPQSHEPVLVDALGGFLAAFATNATGVQPISGVDETTFRPCPDLLDRLASALDAAPWQSL